MHDDSKFGPEEFPIYATMMDKFEKYPYASEGYNKAKEAVKPATDHHYKCNRHHPEHFLNGIDSMNLVDLVEMLCDWKSATQNHPEHPGDLKKSIILAGEKYKISPQLAQILYNTAIDFKML